MNASALVVPQADPGAGYRALQPAIDEAVLRVLGSGRYILVEEGRAFEREFSAWLGTRWAIGCASGTDALTLALRALGVGPGSAVATVSHTAVATVAAIELAGAEPVLLDIEPQFYTLNPGELAAVVTDPVPGAAPIRAVIAVHLYGQAIDLDPVRTICAQHEVALIEDCSQSHGAIWQGRKLGTYGAVAAFSLYPTKNLGALGDAGVVATSDAGLSERLAALRQYGWNEHRSSEQAGMNSRLDEVQAAILRVQLTHLDARNRRRQAVADAYDAALSDGPLRPPARRAGAEHVFHQYVIRAPDRAQVQARLQAEGIGTSVHYPVPVHLQPAYAGRVRLGPAGCHATERAAEQVLGLPMFPELTDAQVEHVCAGLHRENARHSSF